MTWRMTRRKTYFQTLLLNRFKLDKIVLARKTRAGFIPSSSLELESLFLEVAVVEQYVIRRHDRTARHPLRIGPYGIVG